MFCPCPCPWYFCPCPCPCPRHCWKISFLLFLPLPPFPPCYVTFLPLPLPSISPMKEWNRGQGQGQKNGKTGGKWGQGQKRGQNHKLLECPVSFLRQCLGHSRCPHHQYWSPSASLRKGVCKIKFNSGKKSIWSIPINPWLSFSSCLPEILGS